MMPSASVISEDPLDIEYLQEEISQYFPLQSFTTDHYPDFISLKEQPVHKQGRVVVARIVMDGFFDFLKQAKSDNTRVIALVDGTQEEILAARFIGLQYIAKADFALNNHVHHLFHNEKAIV